MRKTTFDKLLLFFAVLLAGLFLYALAKDPGKEPRTAGMQDQRTAHITFLNVGQGDATLIQEGEMQILIDGGDGKDILNRLGESMPFADKRIDLVVVSHPDEDHMGGLLKVLESYEVGMVMEPGIACDKSICEKWEQAIAQEGATVTNARLGQDLRYGEDVRLTVLYPFEDLSGKKLAETNESSLVIRAEVEGRRYLLTGDTEAETEKRLVESSLDLDADVLKVSHHGSKSASSAAFLSAVTPETAVISVGENSYGHPTAEVLTRLQNMNIKVLRTDEQGSIAF